MPFITTTHLAGNLSGTFYLDDVRLVTGIPAAPPVEPPPVTAVLEERSEAVPASLPWSKTILTPSTVRRLLVSPCRRRPRCI